MTDLDLDAIEADIDMAARYPEMARHVALDHAADLISEIRRLRAEVERLGRWKAEALPVLSGLQDIGDALAVPLGQSITGPESVQRARDMVAALDQVRALHERLSSCGEKCGEMEDFCGECGTDWPCQTVSVLDGEGALASSTVLRC